MSTSLLSIITVLCAILSAWDIVPILRTKGRYSVTSWPQFVGIFFAPPIGIVCCIAVIVRGGR